jgi:chromate transport protein ChrA
LILAAFIGYYVAAVPGAVAATVAVFTVPVVLAGFAAQLVAKLNDASWFRAFGRFAAAAAVGLLSVTLLALARPLVDIHPVLLLGSVAVLAAELRGVHPIILIAVASLLGGVTGFYIL